MVSIKKAHLLFGFLISIGSPVISGLGSYYSAIGDIRENYVKKDDFDKLRDKIDRIAEDVARIRGSLERQR